MGLSLGNSGLRKVAGQGTRGEQKQGRKKSNRSLCPWWREGSRVQFQIKQAERRGTQDAGRRTQQARVRVRWMPAGLPGSFAEAGCGEEPARRAQLIGLTGVDQPWEQTQQTPRNYNLPQGRTQSLISNSAGPRTLGAEGRGDADSHTEARDTLRHAHTPTHAGTHVLTVTHTHSDEHLLPPLFPPAPPPPPASQASLEGGDRPHCSIYKQAPPRLPAPTKVMFCCSKFSCPVCLPLPKVKSSHEIKVKASEQSMKIWQPTAPCASWN